MKLATICQFLIAATLAGSFIVGNSAQTQTPKTIWDGVYTKAQAERGSEPYVVTCGSCHGQTGRGGPDAPGIIAYTLDDKWAGVPLVGYFQYIKTEMPKGRPQSLSAQGYIDIIAYLLSMHGAPAGTKELPIEDDALGEITITVKP